MRRRCFRKPAVTLSVFPFLAVLVCTMGALIVLFVAVLQKARVDAADVAETQSGPSLAEMEQLDNLRLEKEDQEWRRSELERQRTEYQQQLTRQRLTLSHFEDHIRNLEEQWKQLSAQAEELKRIGSQRTSGFDDKQEKLRTLRAEIDKRREQLTEAQRQAAGRKRTFAIIPYEGPNGTKRRPIYIECTDQGIVLQPEGVVLAPSDFIGSLGPGNPLDAALRTTREYLAKYGEPASQGEPYPLLIVRPNGTVAYCAARAALKSWDDEFGYELVEADLKLAYPKPDPALAQELHRSINDARQRQVVLASIMPGRYRQSGATGFVATSNGGFSAVGDSGAPTRAPGFAVGVPGADLNSSGSSFMRTFRDASLEADERVISMQAAQRSTAQSTGKRAGTSARQPTGMSNSNGSPPPTTSPPPNSTSPFGQPGLPGASQQFAAAKPAGSAPDAASDNQSQSNQNNQNQAGKSRGPARKAPIGMQPIANSRGSDWGLPNRGSTTTGIQRFVQIECHPDRLVLLQDHAEYRSPIVVPMPAETAAAIDPFVAALWNRMDQWGLAADGCFWKPVLRVHVHPDAEQRFAELSTLLDYSGMVVQRKN